MTDEPIAKPVVFEGSSREDIREFPDAARRRAGHELHLISLGEDPGDWKPMQAVGPGAREIRIRAAGAGGTVQHRVVYVAKFDDAVHVLHAFEKKTEKTSQHDIDLARRRYREMMAERTRQKP